MNAGPLSGLRVLDLSRLLPGGYATLLLADLGADVVKVEEPGTGDYIRWMPPLVGDLSAGHIALNRNKRSLTLNLKSDEGRRLFLDLVPIFDILIESFRPGVMDRLGVGWGKLQEVNPALIYCAISGYGQDGPRAQEAGHDVNYMGYSGASSIIGEQGGGPVVPGVQVGDIGGGGMAAVIAILSALHARSVTGVGDLCDISMTDGAFSWLSIHAAEHVATGVDPERGAMPLSGAYPCYRIYPAADGFLSVGALEPQFWSELCSAIERPDLASDGFATGERRRAVIDELENVFRKKTRAEWAEVFSGRDVCVGPVNSLSEAFRDPQLLHRSMIVEGELPEGEPWRFVGNPIKLASDARAPALRPPPALGEHTEEILSEVGVAPERLDALRAEGVV